MTAISWAIVCLAYVLGLLLVGISGDFRGIPIGSWGILTAGAIAAFFIPRYWRTAPRSKVWLLAGIVGFVAGCYFQLRMPTPAANDISQRLVGTEGFIPAEIQGRIDSPPRLTRSQKIQFELKARAAIAPIPADSSTTSPQQFIGNVYVTVPLLQGTGLYPGQQVTLRGSLYRPKPASNPGGFNFQSYLKRQGIFAGFSATQVELPKGGTDSPPLLWSIRQRITRAQVSRLGVPEGPLLSAMVMGRRAVDVPFDLQDQFKQAGLAHALAASGAQVSMLVGVILGLTQRLSARLRLGLGVGIVLLYMGLTGLEAAVLRAAIMGVVALFALTAERKVKPLGSIVFTAVALLLWQPLWIFDLGFQLSFLATLGLLVTVPVLNQWLDWLPTAIAPFISVPVAAYLWTLPLCLFAFGIVSPYSIGINILTSPLITVISIGGMVSALAALIDPAMGSILAWLLYYPIHTFIKLAEFGNHLPGTTFAVGAIALSQVLMLYALFLLIWWKPRWQRYWWVAGLIGISLVAIPTGYNVTHLSRATVLAVAGDPVLVLQDRGTVGLINSGNETDAQLTLLPFFQKQGINRLNWAIATNLNPSNLESWQRLKTSISVQQFYSPSNASETAVANHANPQTVQNLSLTPAIRQERVLPLSETQSLQLGATNVDVLSLNPFALKLQMAEQTWLLLNHLPPVAQQTAAIAQFQQPIQVLWWSGEELAPQLLAALKPEVAIASAKTVPPATEQWLKSHNAVIYCTGRDGAVQWMPDKGFITLLESEV
jgi:competence protein ComEC